jgi:hypothetical protein
MLDQKIVPLRDWVRCECAVDALVMEKIKRKKDKFPTIISAIKEVAAEYGIDADFMVDWAKENCLDD